MFVRLEKLNAERDSLEMEWGACNSSKALVLACLRRAGGKREIAMSLRRLAT